MSKKKILHVVNISFVIPYFLGDQIQYLNSKGYEVHIACTKSDHFYELSRKYNFIPFEVNIIRKIDVKEDVITIIKIYKYIKNNNIDIVIGHTPKGGMLSQIAARFAGVEQRIYFRHGLMFETSKGLKKLLLKFVERLTGRLSSKIVAVSESVKNKSIEERLNNPKKEIILNKGTCNGVDIEYFNKSRSKINSDSLLKYKWLQEKFVIGFVGRLVNDKGVKELIGAYQILKYRYENLALLLVGPIEERDRISEGIIKYIKQDDSIVHTGYIDDTYPFYQLMDVFVLPSYREGFPTVVLEASAMEIPVITTKSTGCIDSIIDGKSGLFSKIEANDLAIAISTYIDSPELIKMHGEFGRLFIKNNFDQKLIWQEIEKKILF